MIKKVLVGFLAYYFLGVIVINISSLKYYDVYKDYRDTIYPVYSIKAKLFENLTSPAYWFAALWWPMTIPFLMKNI